MSNHPAVETVIDRIRRDVIGGAADIAKEVVQALTELVENSQIRDVKEFTEEFQGAVLDILRVTPSFAPPVNAMNRLLVNLEKNVEMNKSITEVKKELLDTSREFQIWAEGALSRIAQFGAEKIKDGDTVFMYSMSSTVWRILRWAKAQNKSFNVMVTESRPMNEGLWTVDAMLKEKIPVSVSIDACIGELVAKSDIVFVGADAIGSNGFAFCKVGTYPTALVARRHGVPFYIAADTLKFDAGSLLGLPFRADPVPHHDVLDENYPQDIPVIGRLFDETPPDLITGIITEVGILPPTACANIILQMKLSQKLSEWLPAWAFGSL
jgi:ribose 1,5-bisphosphate isomerase